MIFWRRPVCLFLVALLFLALNGCQRPQSCLDGDSYNIKGDLESAVDSYLECMKEMNASSDGELGLKVMNLKVKITQKTLEDAEKILADEKTLPLLRDAIKLLEKKEKYDTKDQSIANKIEEYEHIADEFQQNISKLLEKARIARDEKSWDLAISNIIDAEVFYPKSAEIDALKNSVITTRDSYYTRNIANECGKKNYDSAMEFWQQWTLSNPAPSGYDSEKMFQKILDTKDVIVNELVDQYILEQKYYSAYILINESGVRNIEKKLNYIISEGSNYYKNLAYKKKANVEDFQAYIAAYKANELSSGDNEIFKLYCDCEEKVKESLKVTIAYEAFEYPQDEPDVGREVSDMLSSSMLAAMPYGFSLDERKKLEFIKSQTDTLQNALTIQGVQFGLFGGVSVLTVNHEKEEKIRKVKVEVSHKEKNNQQYLDMVKEYGYEKSSWPFVPKEILEEITYDYIDNYLGEESIEGLISVSVRIYSTRLGEIAKSNNFTVSQKLKDTFREPLPAADIEEDPRELAKSKLEVKQELKEEAVAKITDWIIDYFEPRQQFFAEDMQQLIERRDTELAIQYAAQGFLYCQESKISEDDQWFKELKQNALFDLTEGVADNQ